MATLQITGTVSAVSGTSDAIGICSSNMSLAGDLPTISLSDAVIRSTLDTAATLSDLRFSGWFDNWMNFHPDSKLPALLFSGAFAHELKMPPATLPVTEFSGVGGFVIPVRPMPVLGFSGEIRQQKTVNIAGNLPVVSFSGSFGAQPSTMWYLPPLTFDGAIEAIRTSQGNIAGALPALVRPDSFVYHDEVSGRLSGSFSPLFLAGEIKKDTSDCNLAGTLPPVGLDMFMEAVADVGGNMTGRFPVLSISGSITGDPNFNMYGTLPPLSAPASGSIGSGGPAATTPDTAPTGDEVIRHRRGE